MRGGRKRGKVRDILKDLAPSPKRVPGNATPQKRGNTCKQICAREKIIAYNLNQRSRQTQKGQTVRKRAPYPPFFVCPACFAGEFRAEKTLLRRGGARLGEGCGGSKPMYLRGRCGATFSRGRIPVSAHAGWATVRRETGRGEDGRYAGRSETRG